MDARDFDRLSRTLSTAGSRRAALAAGAAVLGLAGAQRTIAQTDCTLKADGERCSDGTECCSGLCKRRHNGKKVCKAAETQGICTAEKDNCTNLAWYCGDQTNGQPCVCYVTTQGRSFCGNDFSVSTDNCGCDTDRQCEQRFGKGTKCIQMNSNCGICPDSPGSCMAPCPSLASPP